jgi:hypothetical protein
MKQRVYVETTIVSYLTARPVRDIMQLARQVATRQWWRQFRATSELYASQLVVTEAGQGDTRACRRRLKALASIPLLPLSEEAVLLTKKLVSSQSLPTNAEDDAAHVAIASVNGMDILLTWNCRHIANAMAMPKIIDTIHRAGYPAPMITTPAILLESMEGTP